MVKYSMKQRRPQNTIKMQNLTIPKLDVDAKMPLQQIAQKRSRSFDILNWDLTSTTRTKKRNSFYVSFWELICV